MALKVELKPNERIIIGTAVVRNGDQRTSLVIEGNAPILREKDILSPRTADTPAKLIYLAIQIMYIDGSVVENTSLYKSLMRDFQIAVPSSSEILHGIHEHMLNGELYKALKEARRLVAYEKEVLSHAPRDPGVQSQPVALAQSA